MKRTLLLLLSVFCVLNSIKAQNDTLLDRYQQWLFRTEQPQPTNRAATLNAQGQWPDLDYTNKDKAGWKVALHLSRVRQMAFSWQYPASSVYHNDQLLKKIFIALDHWLQHRYQNSNWWHNEIGVPRYMRDIIILLRNELSGTRLQHSLEVMAQHRMRDDFVGGNLIWCADLALHYGALTRNDSLVRHCRNRILQEISITTGEGIQPDYSFHQHGKRLQMYQYGKAYLTESLRIAWQCRGTAIAFPDEKTTLLSDLLLKGWQWMARGIYTVPGTMDRSSSRRGELKSPDLRPLIPFMEELQPRQAAAFREMQAIQNGQGSLTGFRYYPYSDFAIYHRPGFSFFLKTISTRTLPTESINSENLKGKLLNSGDTWLIKNGHEYTDMMPLWDWTALPGVTMFEGAHSVQRKDFVGSVSNGNEGISVMDYTLQDSAAQKKLTARKSWACHGDLVVCLIAGLDTKGAYTALDQCRWQGDIMADGRKWKEGQHLIKKARWIHHAGFGYIPLQPVTCTIRLQPTRGNWTNINASETKENVEASLFIPVLQHDRVNDGYVLALCKSPEQTKTLAQHPAWTVLRNDKDCQAVSFKDGTIMIVFYTSSVLPIEGYGKIEADQPCLLLVKNGRVFASDPSHTGITVNIRIGESAIRMVLPGDGNTVSSSFR